MKSLAPIYFATLLAVGIHQTNAASSDFAVDPAQSSITLSGNVAGLTFSEQGPGSLTTSFSGDVTADLTDSSVAITAGTLIAGTNGNWLPGPNGQGGAAPANYGGQASSFIGTVTAALRNIQLGVTSPATPLSSDSFDAGNIVFSFSETSLAALDYNAGFLGSGSKNLAGNATNKTATVATITSDTLVINIDATFTTSLLSDNDSSLHIVGKITAVKKALLQFVGYEVVDHEIRLKINGDINSFKLESTTDYQQWNERQPEVVIENNVPIYKLPASADFEVFRLTI